MDCSFLSQEGRVAVITGGSRGIGRSIALTFADAGADIAISGRKQENLDKAAGEIKALGRRALAITANARKMDELKAMVDKIMQEYGRIDVLVNNAATNPAMGTIVNTDEKIFDIIMETNIKSYFMMSKLVGKIMMEQKSGYIINISSAGGITPAEGLGPYCISKAAINMLTKQLALELGSYNVRVNAIAPRVVKTEFSKALWSNEKLMQYEYQFTPLKCVATPDEIGHMALYLASSSINYMTGQVLIPNGGAFFI